MIDRFILCFLQFWVKKKEKIEPCNDINIGIYVIKNKKGEIEYFSAIFNRKFMV